MDNPIATMADPQAGQSFPPDSNPPAHIVGALPNPDPNQVHNGPGTTDPNQAAPVTPAKRKPGRPKGSGKKQLYTPVEPKIKRPVGRPRKDGYPAGSVGSRRSVRPSKPTPAKPPAPSTDSAPGLPMGQGFFPFAPGPWQAIFPPQAGYPQGPPPNMTSISAPVAPTDYRVDPNIERDDWADLARTNPNAFLITLLTSLAAPNPVSSAGPSVAEAFKSHLVSLAPNPSQVKGNQPIPSLYSILKTFWLPSSPAYFSLTASASTARTPSEHRFLYWDPQPLVFNGIACPNCSAPLTNRGRIRSGPIKVYDLEKPFFVIGCEYVCKSSQCVAATSSEGRKFASTDSSVLRSLPARLKDEFPAHLVRSDTDSGTGPNIWNWQAMGVSRSLWNMVRGCLRSGLTKDAILQLVRAIQHGVPDDVDKEEEEEDFDEEEEEQQEAQHDGDGNAGQTTGATSNQEDHFNDAYNNAWKANSAVAKSSISASPEARTTSNAPAAPNSNQTSPSSNPYRYLQAGPYPFPYPTFPFYQQPAGTNGITNPGANNASLNAEAGPSNLSNANNQPSNESNTNTTSGPGSSTDAGPSTSAPDQNQSQPQTPTQNILKRPYTFTTDAGAGNSEGPDLEISQKRVRHCCKCGSQECKGKGGRSFCMSACQDCGKLDCKGRNSRRPDKRCAEAWS